MRIAFVTNNYTPFSGGVVSSINASVAQLHKRGHTVRIITLDFLGEQQTDDPIYVTRLVSPIKFKYKKNHMAIPWRSDKQVLATIKEFAPEIIHSHHPFLLGQSALVAARALGIPILFTYHTLYEQYVHYAPFPHALSQHVVNKVVRSYCNSVDRIIAPTQIMHNYIQDMQVTTPITVLPSAIQECFLAQTIEPFVCPQSSFNLLLVSRFTKEKNIPFLLDVFAQLRKKEMYTFTLVGYGDEYEFLQWYAYQKLGLSRERVLFVHKPERDELLRLYRQADLFLFSSTTDTQGLVLAEAMASGLPVIALDGPGQRAIIIQGGNGFLVANQHEMAARVEQVAADRALQGVMKEGALQTAKGYAGDVIGERLVTCYQSLL